MIFPSIFKLDDAVREPGVGISPCYFLIFLVISIGIPYICAGFSCTSYLPN